MVQHKIYSFQFHKGAIRTFYFISTCEFPSTFQFHKGAIRTDPSFKASNLCTHFNSIKVRLELMAAGFYGAVTVISIP